MKKILLASVFVLVGCFAAKPAQATITGVYNTALSSNPIIGTCISSVAASDLSALVNASTPSWVNICVQNYDTANMVFVAYEPVFSTSTFTDNKGGIAVAAAQSSIQVPAPLCFPVPTGKRLYAMTGKTTACSNIRVFFE